MVNAPELRKALDLVLDASAQNLHRQDTWIARTSTEPDCGTAGCLAGLYALSQGCTPVFTRLYSDFNDPNETAIVNPPGDPNTEITVGAWARIALGLSREQSARLFAVNNSTADLKEIVDELCASS